MILSDKEITERCQGQRPMIEPFIPHGVKESNGVPVISYGLSSYGYDIRCHEEFKIFHNAYSTVVDPKRFDAKNFIDMTASEDPISIPPNSFALCRSLEYMTIPRDILAICLGKSTYARCGIVVNVTPLEPEWEGHITIEISNTTPNPAWVYPREGICQLVFLRSENGCRTSYSDRAGKYQKQKGVTLPKV